MITVRPIHSDEIDVFVSIGTDPSHRSHVKQYIEKMLDVGSMCLDWSFIAEFEGRPVGRVAFWTLSGMKKPLDIVLLEVPWTAPDNSIGVAFLKEVAARAKAVGAEDLGYCMDTPPSAPHWQFYTESRMALLDHCGFTIARETYRFEWHHPGSPFAETTTLQFRSLAEVGEPAFIEAIMRVSEGTFDARIRADRDRYGAATEARNMFTDLGQMQYDPEWWQLVYDADNELVGLVMPTRNPTAATIGYIGVVPEKRGRGYIDSLLKRGTAILVEAGATVIRADTDLANFPMAAAFRRANYEQFATRCEYALQLG